MYEPEVEEDECKILQKELDFTASFCEYINANEDVILSQNLSVDDICDL